MSDLPNDLRNRQAALTKDGAADKPLLLVAADRITELEQQLADTVAELQRYKGAVERHNGYLCEDDAVYRIDMQAARNTD